MKLLNFLLFALFTGLALPMSAQNQWIDLTDYYLQNPNFDNNSNAGWIINANAQSTQCNFGCQEFWYGTFDIYQDITNIPDGRYRLTVNAYYRPGDYNNNDRNNYVNNGIDNGTAVMYANTTEQKIASCYSETYDGFSGNWAYGGWWDAVYYPNNMEAANYCFEQGLYTNQMEFTVSGGNLRLGLKNNTNNYSNWCIFDNFKLEYYGQNVIATSLRAVETSLNITPGLSQEIKYVILPLNTLIKTLEWSSSNSAIATVDANGIVTGVSDGECTITGKTIDGSNKQFTVKVVVKTDMSQATKLIINEVQSANVDMFVDPSFNFGGWIEIYNPTNTTIPLAGLYVGNDPENPCMYLLKPVQGVVPAHGFQTIWFDHASHYAKRMVDAKLDCDGGTIFLASPDGTIISQVDYPAAVSRTSWARLKDGGDEWGLTAEPTPDASNASSHFATERLEAPSVSHDSQIFDASIQVSVNIPTGSKLIFTTDGSTPTLTNGQESKTGLFNVNNTSTYRFRLFEDGKIPSAVVTRSYIYRDKDFSLPILSIVGNNEVLYGNELGIFVKGTNGRPGAGQSSPCNWNMDWDHPVNFEYITTDNVMAANQEVDICAVGGWSRAWNPHSFKLKAGKEYEGLNYIPYQFFTEKPALKHKVLQVRNGGNDNGCRIKDAALQKIIRTSGLNVDTQGYQPVVHYINGRYIGVINVREPNNKHYAYANYGIDTDNIDQFEMSPDSGYVQKSGDKESFNRWYDLALTAADDESYEEICKLVDIDAYCNYMAIEMYLGGTDWPQNNIKGFREKTDDARFRFVTFDLDGTFATNSPFTTFENKQFYTFDSLFDTTDIDPEGLNGNRYSKEIEFVTIFLNMLQNDKFRKQFIDSYCLVAGSVFEPSRCNEIIDRVASNIEAMMTYERNEWGGSVSPWSTANNLKNSLTASRQNSFTDALKQYWRMGLDSTNKQLVTLSSNVDCAHLFVNDLPVPTDKFSGYLFAPITLRASAPAGFRFAGWKGTNTIPTVNNTPIFAKGAQWSYYDKGAPTVSNWTKDAVASWSRGNAPLGYFTSDVNNSRGYNTTLDYGGNANAKYPTYYFRRNATLTTAPTEDDVVTLDFTCDDGFIIYINGTEAGRYLMPEGNVDYNTFATTYAPNNPDSGQMILPSSLFKRGSNTIAVEVHNNNANSTDIYWDASLSIGYLKNGSDTYVSTEEVYEMPTSGIIDLIACYEPLSDQELASSDVHPVKVNEISASNSIYVNEFFKKNDWVELYNTTDDDIDVAGMYLSDNVNKPLKFQIPEASMVEANYSTIIPAHGHLVIWCDKLDPVNEVHASFKLDADGGDIILTAADESWADTLSYIVHNGNQSVGLYPDGGSQLYVMNTTTFSKANIIDSYSTLFEEPKIEQIPDIVESIYRDRSGNLSVTYSAEKLLVRTEEPCEITVNIYTPSGQLVKAMGSHTNAQSTVDVTELPNGIFVAKVADSEGNTCKIKFLR